jgi:hypothetical protein
LAELFFLSPSLIQSLDWSDDSSSDFDDYIESDDDD